MRQMIATNNKSLHTMPENLGQVGFDCLFDLRTTDRTFSQRLGALNASAEMSTRNKNDISDSI